MNETTVDFLIEKTDQFGNVISELAKQMGVAAEHIYAVMVRQQYVEGIVGLIGLSLFMMLAILIFTVSYKSRKALLLEGCSDSYDVVIIRWVGMVVSFILMIVIILVGMHYGKVLLNPEYYAIQDIMEMIRGKISED